MASQAASYGALLAGGVVLTVAVSGNSFREVLAGKASPIRGLITAPPEPAATGGGTATAAAVTPNAAPGTVGAPTAVHGAQSAALPGWAMSRIDAGVDYYGGRVIKAPENGTVLKTGPYGGAGGGFGPGGVLLKLESGQIWYFYEGLTEAVRAGEKVVAGQTIAHGIPGGSIEVGLANAQGNPLAQQVGESTGNNVTKWGKKALTFLKGFPKAKPKAKITGVILGTTGRA